MAVETRAQLSVRMRDSAWSLRITKDSLGVSLSLHWRDRAEPTHEVLLSPEDLKRVRKILQEKT